MKKIIATILLTVFLIGCESITGPKYDKTKFERVPIKDNKD